MKNLNIKEPKLDWIGKYNENGDFNTFKKINLPFQIIERINETQTSREAKKQGIQKNIFEFWDQNLEESFEKGWKNKLIWGDNIYVISSLLEKFNGKVKLIYIDPPFATGIDFSVTTKIGEDNLQISKQNSVIEEKAYRDTWGSGISSYLQMMYQRLILMRNLLHKNGTIYVHTDWHIGHYVKIIMDEIFGRNHFLNEIVWCYGSMQKSKRNWNRKHDTIFAYTKSDDWTFNVMEVLEEYDKGYSSRFKYKDEKGYYMIRGKGGSNSPIHSQGDLTPEHEKNYPEWTYRQYKKKGALPKDWWVIPFLNSNASERVDFSTQKPEELVEKIVKASSDPGDIVADFFCGSGTTLVVAEKLGRRWLGCDIGRFPIHLTRKRLMDINDCKPFEILNLGKYERQIWQNLNFKGKSDRTILFEYYAFILKLYGAEPISGFSYIHGKKKKILIHIGAVDTPVTIEEILGSISEANKIGLNQLDILGWEWEMGLHEIIEKEAKRQGVRLKLRIIPNEIMEEQAVMKGDIKFFELAYLKTKPIITSNTVKIELTDFVIPNMDLISQEVREKIANWSDYIDYWAIDFNFKNDTFINQFTSYRTKENRQIKLVSDLYKYKKPGKHQILVKVIDIFGIDTSQIIDIDIK